MVKSLIWHVREVGGEGGPVDDGGGTMRGSAGVGEEELRLVEAERERFCDVPGGGPGSVLSVVESVSEGQSITRRGSSSSSESESDVGIIAGGRGVKCRLNILWISYLLKESRLKTLPSWSVEQKQISGCSGWYILSLWIVRYCTRMLHTVLYGKTSRVPEIPGT